MPIEKVPQSLRRRTLKTKRGPEALVALCSEPFPFVAAYRNRRAMLISYIAGNVGYDDIIFFLHLPPCLFSPHQEQAYR